MATDRSTIHAIIEHNFYAKRHAEPVIENLREVGATALLLMDLYECLCLTIGIHMKCSTSKPNMKNGSILRVFI